LGELLGPRFEGATAPFDYEDYLDFLYRFGLNCEGCRKKHISEGFDGRKRIKREWL
jgi:hypothetical protein